MNLEFGPVSRACSSELSTEDRPRRTAQPAVPPPVPPQQIRTHSSDKYYGAQWMRRQAWPSGKPRRISVLRAGFESCTGRSWGPGHSSAASLGRACLGRWSDQPPQPWACARVWGNSRHSTDSRKKKLSESKFSSLGKTRNTSTDSESGGYFVRARYPAPRFFLGLGLGLGSGRNFLFTISK